MNSNKKRIVRNAVVSIVNLMLISAIVYGFISWLQGRKQY